MIPMFKCTFDKVHWTSQDRAPRGPITYPKVTLFIDTVRLKLMYLFVFTWALSFAAACCRLVRFFPPPFNKLFPSGDFLVNSIVDIVIKFYYCTSGTVGDGNESEWGWILYLWLLVTLRASACTCNFRVGICNTCSIHFNKNSLIWKENICVCRHLRDKLNRLTVIINLW